MAAFIRKGFAVEIHTFHCTHCSWVWKMADMDQFSLPLHVAVPGPLNKVALSGAQLRKKAKCSHVQNEYPFDASLSPHARPSQMHRRVDWLPIDRGSDEILEAISVANVVILTSDTGSGKTTRVPQYVLDEQQRKGQCCRIVVTEQRRVAAREAGCLRARGRPSCWCFW